MLTKLCAEQIQIRYSLDTPPIISDFSFEVCSGEIVGVIGPNGSGKSTLLKLVSGVPAGGSTEGQVRYRGTDTALACEVDVDGWYDAAGRRDTKSADEVDALRAQFESAYRRRFAFLMPDQDLVLERISVECIAAGEPLPTPPPENMAAARAAVPGADVTMFVGRDGATPEWQTAALFLPESLASGDEILGPAIIAGGQATTVVESGWRARVGADPAGARGRGRL